MRRVSLMEFVALGHAGSEHYAGLEPFPNPGVTEVEMTSDELTAVCPITAQPDFYVARIAYRPDALCLESKSLKLYLARFRNEGAGAAGRTRSSASRREGFRRRHARDAARPCSRRAARRRTSA